MKILLIGGAGFIGTALFAKLGSMGQHELGIYDHRFRSCHDIRDKFYLDRFFQNFAPDLVVLLAARTGVAAGEEHPEEYVSTNILGTINVINACKKYGVRNFIFFSSSSIYGKRTWGGERSTPEDAPSAPISLYGVTKVAGEDLTRREGVDLNYAIIRPFTVYDIDGGREGMVIRKWIDAINSGKKVTVYSSTGGSSRGYTHVLDLVEGVCLIIEQMTKGETVREVYNLGGAEAVGNTDLFNFFQAHCKSVGKKIIRLAGVFNTIGNLVLCNDHGCVLSPYLKGKKAYFHEKLGLKTSACTISDLPFPGIGAIATNTGCLVHQHALDAEMEHIEKTLGVPVKRAEFYEGFPGVEILANSKGLIVPKNLRGPALSEIQEALKVF